MAQSEEARAAAAERMRQYHAQKKAAKDGASAPSIAETSVPQPKRKSKPVGPVRSARPTRKQIEATDRHKERMIALQEGALQYGHVDIWDSIKKDPNLHYIVADKPNPKDGGYKSFACSRDYFAAQGYSVVEDPGVQLASPFQVVMTLPKSEYHRKRIAQEVQAMYQFDHPEVHGGEDFGEARLTENTRKYSEMRTVSGMRNE